MNILTNCHKMSDENWRKLNDATNRQRKVLNSIKLHIEESSVKKYFLLYCAIFFFSKQKIFFK